MISKLLREFSFSAFFSFYYLKAKRIFGLKDICLGFKNAINCCKVKEVGVLVKNCPCLADDMAKIWQVYWDLGAPGATVPDSWPDQLSTDINMK